MGRKKQKVRWTSVEDAGLFDSEQQNSNDQNSPQTDQQSEIMSQKKILKPLPNQRKGFWSQLPPRFERSRPHYADQDLDSNCETEELPNGFTKIRSKNLDVLFRKDYYAQRMLSTTSSSAVSSEAGEATAEEDLDNVINNVSEATVAEENEEEIEQIESESNIEEVKEQTTEPQNTDKAQKSKINSNAMPFYPSRYTVPQYPSNSVSPNTSSQQRPNLFLYSPTSNTMIPCEEIIIPNAIMPGQDVYQGPSNIYLAFPVDGSNKESSASTSPGGTSSNCTPPQAQSPPNSYDGAQSTAPPFNTTPPTTTHTLVQYDQYGIPYTTYTPVMQNAGTNAVEGSTVSVSSASGGVASSTECSSADSTTPHSPPDLSVYNPVNWVPDPSYLQNGAAANGPYQFYPYYTQQPSYYNFRNGHASYQYFIESSTVPSSAGESQNEDRSEGEETPNTATTTTSNSPKKEGPGGVANKHSESNQEVFIPGLPVSAAKRPTKKRRKKKNTVVTPLLTTATPPTIEQHRGSSSSEVSNDKNDVLQAITILQREESKVVEINHEPTMVEEPVIEVTPEPEPEPEPVEQEDFEEVEAEKPDLEILVKEEGEEEVLVVVEKNEIDEKQPETVPEVSVKPPKPHHRRRRGARKSEKNKKLAASLNDDLQIANKTENVEKQWEDIPKEISLDPNEGWETATGGKRGSRRALHVTPIESRDLTPEGSDKPIQIEPVKVTEIEIRPTPMEEPIPDSQDESQSAPVSRKSTLKRPIRKKRASFDGNSDHSKTSLSKPVLISDRDFDVASAVAAQRRCNKSAFFDQGKLESMMADKKTFDTLFISDIGHGMCGGPINLGRFGMGKYVPPDRSNEIYPIPMQEKSEEASELSNEDEEASNAAQKYILKTMMDEVTGKAAAAGLTYIRDAERFTEISRNSFEGEKIPPLSKNSNELDLD